MSGAEYESYVKSKRRLHGEQNEAPPPPPLAHLWAGGSSPRPGFGE